MNNSRLTHKQRKILKTFKKPRDYDKDSNRTKEIIEELINDNYLVFTSLKTDNDSSFVQIIGSGWTLSEEGKLALKWWKYIRWDLVIGVLSLFVAILAYVTGNPSGLVDFIKGLG